MEELLKFWPVLVGIISGVWIVVWSVSGYKKKVDDRIDEVEKENIRLASELTNFKNQADGLERSIERLYTKLDTIENDIKSLLRKVGGS